MHKLLFYIISLVIIPSVVSTQTEFTLAWENHAIGEMSYYARPKLSISTLDSSILFCANQGVGYRADVDCKSFYSNGLLRWEFDFNSPFYDWDIVRKTVIDKEGNSYIIINSKKWTPNSEQGTGIAHIVFIIKIAPNGDVLWEKQYNKDEQHFAWVSEAMLGVDSSIYLVGRISGDTIVEYDETFVLKMDSNGDILWETILEKREVLLLSLKSDTLTLLRKEDGRNYYIENLSKENGNILSSYLLNESETIVPSIYYTDRLGSYYLLQNGPNLVIKKYASNGEFLWRYHKVQNDENSPTAANRAKQLAFDDENNVYSLGTFYNDSIGTAILLTKLDEHGNILWEKQHEGLVYENSRSAAGLSINGSQVLIAGFKLTEENESDFLFLEYDTSSQFLQEIGYHREGSEGYNTLFDMAVDKNGHVYLADKTIINEENYLTLLKYAAPPKAIPEEYDLSDIILFPNPNTGLCYLKGDGIAGINNIMFTNALGQMLPNVQWVVSSDLVEMNVSHLSPGCYWLSLGNEKGDSAVLKMIKIGL